MTGTLKLRAVLAVCLLLASVPAIASLGGDEASVQSDAARMKAVLTTTRESAYTLHQFQTPDGVSVREYLSPSGKVFAVAWQGPYAPNLKQLLGSYSAQFEQAVQASNRPTRRGPVTVQQSNLVVQLSGHMGAFSGRAYLTDQLPAGVTTEAIR